VVTCLGLLIACGGSQESSTPNAAPSAAANPAPPPVDPGPLLVNGEIRVPSLQARLDAFLARPAAERETILMRVDQELERAVWTVSGLEDALGGREKADAAFAAHSREVVGWARRLAGRRIAFVRAQATAAPTIGAGLFGGLMVAAIGVDAVVSATSGFKDGEKDTAKIGDDTTISGSLSHAELSMDSSHTSDGVTTALQIKIEVDPCPDAAGRFKGRARLGVSTTRAGGSVGQRGTLDVAVTGQVDDDAKLVSSDAEHRMEWAQFAGGRGSYVDVSGAIGDTKVRGATLDRSGGAPDESLQASAAMAGMLWGVMLKERVADASQKAWLSGRCVTLNATAAPGPRGLKPSSTSSISAKPRSRIDGRPTGGGVTATLTAGGAGVAPTGTKVPADATFTYTAPGERNKTGTVSLEARSRRGVGKASIDFDTADAHAFHVVGGLEDFQVNQDVCDVMAPFTLNGSVGLAHFSGGLSGTYHAEGAFNFTYAGTYTISLPNGPTAPGTMAATSSGQVAGQAGSGTEKYTLTPIAPCGGR
jgi:hypothetical protein